MLFDPPDDAGVLDGLAGVAGVEDVGVVEDAGVVEVGGGEDSDAA
ncbi:MAG: hypothetical protein ABSH36_09530 [Solirubrobacteraceae bacterium]